MLCLPTSSFNVRYALSLVFFLFPSLLISLPGDERPCQRCIKRGLQDACQDGVRKKAKYLHDAPNEALMPGASNHFHYINSIRQAQQHQHPQSPTYPLNSAADVYTQAQPVTTYPIYNQVTTSGQLPMTDALMNASAYGAQQSPISQTFPVSAGVPQTSMQSLVQAIQSAAPPQDTNTIQDFGGNLFDGQDMAQYNFDPASFNFGNHYGALEFGMLGQMSSGAAETSPGDTSQISQASLTAAGTMPSTYTESPMTSQPYVFGQDQGMGDWRPPTQPQSNVRQQDRNVNAYNTNGMMNQDTPSALTISAGSAFASPTTEFSPILSKSIDDIQSTKPLLAPSSAPTSRPNTQGRSTMTSQPPQPQPQHHPHPHPHPHSQAPPPPQLSQQPQMSYSSVFTARRKGGDPSKVYASVTQPYSYTTGFHSLIAFIQRRFSAQKTLRIAKALASIRPSFLSCTKSLGYEDLIFMEKCFQRTLWEYEDIINACGTPTIVCRRTGEVAAVGKEFTILTGWKKDVLLGKEANLNVNTGHTTNVSRPASDNGAGGGGATTGTNTGLSSRGGITTPRVPAGALDSSRPQPVFLAELLDDDSVIDFYEDFARLAFGDSRSSVTTRCKLLKYRSKEDEAPSAGRRGSTVGTGINSRDGVESMNSAAAAAAGELSSKGGLKRKRPLAPATVKREGKEGNGAGIGAGTVPDANIDELGGTEGKVECSCCWTVKRDLFDLPMMIVMNVRLSPLLSILFLSIPFTCSALGESVSRVAEICARNSVNETDSSCPASNLTPFLAGLGI